MALGVQCLPPDRSLSRVRRRYSSLLSFGLLRATIGVLDLVSVATMIRNCAHLTGVEITPGVTFPATLENVCIFQHLA
jgi:hypothetical protein